MRKLDNVGKLKVGSWGGENRKEKLNYFEIVSY